MLYTIQSIIINTTNKSLNFHLKIKNKKIALAFDIITQCAILAHGCCVYIVIYKIMIITIITCN
jgi:hypothetical protein